MSTCARCSASPADFFNTNGDTLCRICFSAQQQQAADGRATASLADTGVAGVRYSADPASPNGAIQAGIALLGVGVGLGGAILWLTGTLYFWFVLLAGAGLVSLARGLMLRRRR
jgi:hypothetical protein